MRKLKSVFILPLLILITIMWSENIFAACGGTTRVWSGSQTVAFGTANNWTIANVPDSATEDAQIPSATRVPNLNSSPTLGCLEVTTGTLANGNATARTITVLGDYLRGLNSNSFIWTLDHNTTINMNGTAAQTFEAVDPFNYVNIGNNTTVTMTQTTTIRNGLTFTGNTAGTLRITQSLNLSFNTGITIPVGVTVEVLNGATLTSSGNITVNGTLKLNPGSSLLMASGTTLSIGTTGNLNLAGANGNVATLDGIGSVYWNFTMAGSMTANYFRVNRVGTGTTGINVTGSVIGMDNGEFHYINTAGYAMTWAVTAVLPANMYNMGFFDDSAFGNNKSINASAYLGSVVFLDNWSGLGCAVEGCAFENDPNGNKSDWGVAAGTLLTLSTNTNAGKPVNPVVAGAAVDETVIFSFALNQASVATDITQIKFTVNGSAGSSDIDYIQVFKQGASCQTKGAQIGVNFTMSGSPATATVNFSAGDISPADATAKCIHVWIKTTANAENNATIGIKIAATNDVVNSQGYSFSPASGPPVNGGTATISGDPTAVWKGTGSIWQSNGNWTGGNWPTNAINCRIGAGTVNLLLGQDNNCQNMTLPTGGYINWNNTAFVIGVTGSLAVQTGYNFVNAASGELRLNGTTNQSLEILTSYPGTLRIFNTGGVGQDVVSLTNNVIVGGNLIIQDGTLLVPAGMTLSVAGNITVMTGAALDVASGGTVKLGNGKVLTVDLGGTLKLVGNGQPALVTAINTTDSYTVVVNGTIKATSYTFSNLGTNGVTINSGATIDATNHMQTGTFTYPAVNNMTFLRLFVEIPGNSIDFISFQSAGSSATGVTNIYTNVAGSPNTLTLQSYTGDWSGASFDNPVSYALNWFVATNSFKITLDETAPASVGQGETVKVGRYGFQQNAGSGFFDTDLTSLKLTLTGTGSANDITMVKLYRDNTCTGTGGTLLGSDVLTGSPASVTFTGAPLLTVPTHATAPVKRCLYVEYVISSTAVNGNTVGAQIKESTDLVNSLSYTIDSSTPTPRNLGDMSIIGTTTTWTGGTSTDWTTVANWAGGVPTANLHCNIPDTVNDPIISTGIVNCKNVTINASALLTVNAGSTLRVHKDLVNSGTFTQNGTLEFADDGATTVNSTLNVAFVTLGNVVFTRTAPVAGTINLTSDAIMNNLTFNAATKGVFTIGNARTLRTTGDITISGAELKLIAGSTLRLSNTKTLLVSGGTLNLVGTEDATPQNLSIKAKIGILGAGTWGLNSTSGSINLGGFLLEDIDVNGVRIGGTTILTKLSGGQFRNLSTSYASVKAIQFSTTGAIPATSTNVGWNWGPNNAYPANTDGYKIISSSGAGCSSATIDFTGWFGDWYENTATFDVTTKVANVSCNVIMSASASPVSLLTYTASPYNAKILLEWETALEQAHQGFNVYRADAEGNQFQQINTSLVRNIISNTSYRGKYYFIDNNVINGDTYYYYIEDVAIDGTKELHGPVFATPLLALGNPPVAGGDQNTGNSPSTAANPTSAPGIIYNPSFKDLGNGIAILSQTSSGLRLQITPGALTLSPSAWNGAYETMAINGYSKSLVANKPEMLERTLLIEVHPFSTSAQVTAQNITNNILAGHLIAPAPSWADNGSGTLVASYALDATTYATNANYLQSFIEVNPALVSSGGKKFLKVKINPVKFNPVTQDLDNLTQAVVDIGLGGEAWDVRPPIGSYQASPYIVGNTLQVWFEKTGYYSLSYSDLVASQVDGPFKNIPVSDLRLYLGGEEIPLTVTSADAIFNTGDILNFYLPFTPGLHDTKNVAILSTEEILTTGSPSLRIGTLDGNPAQGSAGVQSLKFTAKAEQNNDVFFSDPWGTESDHFYWKRIFAPYPTDSTYEYLNMSVGLPNIDTVSDSMVKIRVYLKGNRGGITEDIDHHLGIYINNITFMVDEIVIDHNNLTWAEFEAPVDYFFPGNNIIKIKSLGTYAPAGEWDVVLIDKMEIDYLGYPWATNNVLSFSSTSLNKVLTFGEFTANTIQVLDVSRLDSVSTMTNLTPVLSNAKYNVNVYTNNGSDGILGRKYFAFTSAAILTPTAIKLNDEFPMILENSANQADLVIIGPSELINEAQELADRRRDQGLDVYTISLEQIYSEYSNGQASIEAVRNFVETMMTVWQTPSPRYLLILGDATYDPKDLFGFGLRPNVSPMALVEGRFYDFGSDNYLVSPLELSTVPRLAVGRIPTSDPLILHDYFEKMLNYENGAMAPDQNAKQITFISDKDTANAEKFEDKVAELAGLSSILDNGLSTQILKRSIYANDAAGNAAMVATFSDAPLFMTMLGHGAENQFASTAFFGNAHVDALTNERLPIVMTLNCLNGNFYDMDNTIEALGEKLILNKDGGAIAFIGSTSMTTPPAQMGFAKSFFNYLGQEAGQGVHNLTLGDVFFRAKLALGDGAYFQDIQNSYLILGDPSMPMPSGMFTPKKTSPAAAVAAPKKKGGCSAFADGGESGPDVDGMLEFLTMLFLIYMGRKVQRRFE